MGIAYKFIIVIFLLTNKWNKWNKNYIIIKNIDIYYLIYMLI
jgi:hypothetical protein